MLGYMAKRDDFEVEFDNEAETLVSKLRQLAASASASASASEGLEAGEGDEDVDVALMAAHIDMYKTKLQGRIGWKRVCGHCAGSGFFL